MGGSAACWGEQSYVASSHRQVNAIALFQQLYNSSHNDLLHSWSGKITVLSRFKDQRSGPAKDPITSVVLERSPCSPHMVGAAWVALAFSKSCWIVSNRQPSDLPHLPKYWLPKASTGSICQTWHVHPHSDCFITFKFYWPFWNLQLLGFKYIRKNLGTKRIKAPHKVTLILGGQGRGRNSDPKRFPGTSSSTVLKAVKL